MNRLERGFELALWGTRFLVLVAVVASLAAAVAMLYMAAADTVTLVSHTLHYAGPDVTAEARAAMRLAALTHVVEIVDGFLLAAFLIIFGLGLYELFISKIEAAEGSAFADSILYVRSLDDLKGKLAKVILIMLVVKVFEQASALRPSGGLDLLWMASSVALVGLALFLAHAADGKKGGKAGAAEH
jgi:uncharacterized membrane protein YqhA